MSQICIYGQISLQNAAANYSYCDNRTLAMVHHFRYTLALLMNVFNSGMQLSPKAGKVKRPNMTSRSSDFLEFL